MTLYNNFIGLDIGKFNFIVAIYGNKETKEYDNDNNGITEFIKDYKRELANSLCILETTGGYEMPLLLNLCAKDIDVHRSNTRKVKNFIRSFVTGFTPKNNPFCRDKKLCTKSSLVAIY